MKIDINYYENQEKFINKAKNSSETFFLFITSKTDINLEEFTQSNIKIIGARFPDLIFDGKLYDDGIISFKIDESNDILFVDNMKDFDFNKSSITDAKSIITLLDGFCKENESFLSKLFENVKVNTNIIGGGAGSLDNIGAKVTFDNNGFYKDCAVLITMKNDLNIASKHGWDYLAGPFIVTSSCNNTIKTIDYSDAFEHYKAVIKKDCGIDITRDNFVELSQNYPLGIIKYQGEQIVRDPISFKDGHLELIAKISTNSMINVLKGNKENLLKASKEASKEANSKDSDFLVVFSCISRKGFLEEDFDKELEFIYNENPKMIGVTTLGEVANSGNRYINLLNKTCVIGGVCN